MAVNFEEMEDLFYEPIRRLTQDQRRAAETMSDQEVRYLIDLYYNVQESRKRSQNQVRASSADREPNTLTQFLAAQVESLEGICNASLQIVARRTRTGRWLMGIKGISGVLTAGLLASVQIEHAPTAASVWRFAGLDPSWHWLGKEHAARLYSEVREEAGGRSTPLDLLPTLAARATRVEPPPVWDPARGHRPI